MAQFAQPFDPASAPPRQTALPAGEYVATYITDELTNPPNGGEQLKIEFALDAPNAGRKVWARITMTPGPSAKPAAGDIGKQQLAELAAAFGQTTAFRGTQPFFGKRLILKLGIESAQGNFPERNKVVAFKPHKPGATVAAPRPATPSANFSAPAPSVSPAAPPRVELPTLDLESIGPFHGLDAAQLAEHAGIAAEDAHGALLYESMIRAGYPVEAIRAKLASIKAILGIATVSIGMADDAPDKTSNALQAFAAKMEAAATARAAHWASREPVAVPDAEPENGAAPTDDDLPF